LTQDTVGLKTDEWGASYNYSGGITITSTGSGSTITKKIADANSDYLRNTVYGTINDNSGTPPGTAQMDSIDINITIPNGAGSTTSKTYQPDANGSFTLDSIPAGTHPLRIIYTPNNDTLFRYVTIFPRHKSSLSYKFAGNYFSGGGGGPTGSIVYVNESDELYSSCENLRFDITNTGPSSITVTNLRITWSSPTAYYEKVKWDGSQVADNMPRKASGELCTLSPAPTINSSETVTIDIESFKNDPTSGSGVNMINTNFTVEFSDGSVITFVANLCN
jgi:hypothetical protein